MKYSYTTWQMNNSHNSPSHDLLRMYLREFTYTYAIINFLLAIGGRYCIIGIEMDMGSWNGCMGSAVNKTSYFLIKKGGHHVFRQSELCCTFSFRRWSWHMHSSIRSVPSMIWIFWNTLIFCTKYKYNIATIIQVLHVQHLYMAHKY